MQTKSPIKQFIYKLYIELFIIRYIDVYAAGQFVMVKSSSARRFEVEFNSKYFFHVVNIEYL